MGEELFVKFVFVFIFFLSMKPDGFTILQNIGYGFVVFIVSMFIAMIFTSPSPSLAVNNEDIEDSPYRGDNR